LNNIVVITTILEPERTIKLAQDYARDSSVCDVYIYDNGHEKQDAEMLFNFSQDQESIHYVDTRGLTLHGQWNKALEYAKENHPCTITLSNDDITISDKMVSTVSDVLNSNNDYWIAYPANMSQHSNKKPLITKGTKADGGMDGCCFMIKSQSLVDGLPLIDERFVYWGGDDDIARNVEAMGKRQVRVNTVWVDHVNSATTSKPGFEWMREAVASDRILLKEKWGITR
jgi:GT2 family glycosyltransferase